MVSRNYRKGMQFTDTIAHLYPELTERAKDAGYKRPLTQSLTFQVTDDCNLACTYCYQTCKGKRRMSFETAKKAVDMLLTGDKGMSEYINPISSPALTHMVELGYDDINANCVYEKGWATTHAVVLYAEMKRVADYFLNTDLNFLDGSFRCSLYENRFFCPKEETDVQNWCGGNGVMLSVDPDGVFYPLLRLFLVSVSTTRRC